MLFNKKIYKTDQAEVIGFVLTMMAGWVDITGFRIVLHERSGFMTGRTSLLAEALFNGNLSGAMFFFLLILSFFGGAYVGARVSDREGLKWGLVISSALLLLATVFCFLKLFMATAFFLPAAMGTLNASTSVTGIGRTTHLTGPITDIGIHLARKDPKSAIFWISRWVAFLLGAIGSLNAQRLTGADAASLLLVPSLVLAVLAFISSRLKQVNR